MKSITMRKDALIARIEENMQSHHTTYLAAVEAFREQQTELLESMLTRAKNGRSFDRMALSRMPVPEDHTEDYQVALEMLGDEVNDEIELEDYEYRRFMRDEWEWRDRWLGNTASYTGHK